MAIASMVLGILGLWGVPFVMAILALVFGYTSRNSIDRSEGRESGRSMAVAGIVLGYVGLVTSIGVIFFYVWWFREFPNILKNLPTPSP
jgi:predicted PurR-regulated permease PerM